MGGRIGGGCKRETYGHGVVLTELELDAATVGSVKRLLKAMEVAGWKDGASVTKLAVAICSMTEVSVGDVQLLEQSIASLDMPRHLRSDLDLLLT